MPRLKAVLHRSHQRDLTLLICLTLILALTQLIELSPAQAQYQDSQPATFNSAQVRIYYRGRAMYDRGRAMGGGTLVARNWALTTATVVPNFSQGRYNLIFGTVDPDNAPRRNVRVIDRVVPHPNQADILLVHFAEEVPANTWIPNLAEAAPQQFDPAYLFGWGNGGEPLGVLNAPIEHPGLDGFFDTLGVGLQGAFADIPPLMIGAIGEKDDFGSGIFNSRGVLLGTSRMTRHISHGEGPFFFSSTFAQPIWRYREWIQSVINESPPSTSTSQQSGQPQRQLAETLAEDLPPDAKLQMTLPPQKPVCDLSDGGCATQHWAHATLTGRSQGASEVTCATTSPDGCTFAGKTYEAGQSATLALGEAGGTGTREVLAWCVSQAADPLKVELSFTNIGVSEDQLGYGWWTTTSDFIKTDSTSEKLDGLSTC